MTAGVSRFTLHVAPAMMGSSVLGGSAGQVVDLGNAKVMHISLGPECQIPTDMNSYCVSNQALFDPIAD